MFVAGKGHEEWAAGELGNKHDLGTGRNSIEISGIIQSMFS